MGKADLHIHTRYGDGMATVPELLRYVEERTDLDVIAVTEHDTMRAADEARDLHARGRYPFRSGPRRRSDDARRPPARALHRGAGAELPRIEETLAAIHRQGGLAVAPHPLSWLTRSVSERVLARVAAIGNDGVHFDGIEELNGSPAGRVASAKARRLNRERFHLAAIGSSDAHFLASVGCAHTRLRRARSSDDCAARSRAKATSTGTGRSPRLAELGYRNIALPAVARHDGDAAQHGLASDDPQLHQQPPAPRSASDSTATVPRK